MTGWLIFALYVMAWLGSGYWLTRRMLIAMERRYARFQYEDLRRLDGEDRVGAAFAGFALSLFLPGVALAVVALWDVLANRTNLFRTPNEIAKEREVRRTAELEAYRRQALEYGLPVPEVPER